MKNIVHISRSPATSCYTDGAKHCSDQVFIVFACLMIIHIGPYHTNTQQEEKAEQKLLK